MINKLSLSLSLSLSLQTLLVYLAKWEALLETVSILENHLSHLIHIAGTP